MGVELIADSIDSIGEARQAAPLPGDVWALLAAPSSRGDVIA